MLKHNLLLDCDSYKLSHIPLYPEGTTGVHSYIEARKPNEIIIPFGLQMLIKKYLLSPITKSDITEYCHFGMQHGEPVFPEVFEYLLEKYNGYLPIKIWAIPEGTPTKSQTPIVVIECLDEKLKFLPSYLETLLLRGIWYPTTIASNDRNAWIMLNEYYSKCSDVTDVSFAYHDFAGRGNTSEESAQIGSAAHLVYFKGSDTISGVRCANHYYNTDMAAFSVVATEHSIQCAYGPDNQKEYFNKVLDTYENSGIVSIVLDGYDVFREMSLLSTIIKERLKSWDTHGPKIVYRPDSGNPKVIIPVILAIQEKYLGSVVNSKGYRVIPHVGIIQGDGVNHQSMKEIMELVTSLGYAPETVIFGSGGDLAQNVHRDDYGFAQKVSAILIDGVWRDVYKAPITDSGKRSKAGKQLSDDMVLFYDGETHPGVLLHEDNLATIRKRAAS